MTDGEKFYFRKTELIRIEGYQNRKIMNLKKQIISYMQDIILNIRNYIFYYI